jgi:hypothetical protein
MFPPRHRQRNALPATSTPELSSGGSPRGSRVNPTRVRSAYAQWNRGRPIHPKPSTTLARSIRVALLQSISSAGMRGSRSAPVPSESVARIAAQYLRQRGPALHHHGEYRRDVALPSYPKRNCGPSSPHRASRRCVLLFTVTANASIAVWRPTDPDHLARAPGDFLSSAVLESWR